MLLINVIQHCGIFQIYYLNLLIKLFIVVEKMRGGKLRLWLAHWFPAARTRVRITVADFKRVTLSDFNFLLKIFYI